MHVPASAVTLARSMLSLSRARATGVLSVRSDTSECRFAIVDGTLRAAVSNTRQAPLGDILVKRTGCDPQALSAALSHDAFLPPAGAWFVQRGLVSREAVMHALREQLEDRVRAVFRWRRHDLRFEVRPAEIGVYWLRDPLPTEAMVLSGMRAAVAERPNFAPDLAVRQADLLMPWGRGLLEAGATTDAERALADVLQRGAAGTELIAAATSCEQAYRTWWALRAFGALVPRVATHVNYSLLLRKRAQLRRSATPAELLDLSTEVEATAEAPRRALRKLAMHLHPDKFGPDAPHSARALSVEVMQALTRAVTSLTSSVR
jgi:hypothetical protein